MDADDVVHPERFSRQLQVLESRPEVVLVGTLADGIDSIGRRVRPRDRWRVVRRSAFPPFPHGSVMFRRSAFEAVGGYRDAAVGGEDFDLFHRMAEVGRVVTLPDLLYRYRYHRRNSTLTSGTGSLSAVSMAMLPYPWSRYYAAGAMRLWSGAPVAVLRDLVTDPAVRWDRRSLAVLAWATWGELSPATLRLCIRSVASVRDQLCGMWVMDGEPCEWRFER